VSYGPLSFGLLTGTITERTVFAEGDWRGEQSEPDDPDDVDLFDPEVLPKARGVVDRLRPIAEGLHVTLPELALAWNTHQPGVTSAIAGSRNPRHVRSNAAAGDLSMSPDTLAELEALLADAGIGGG